MIKDSVSLQLQTTLDLLKKMVDEGVDYKEEWGRVRDWQVWKKQLFKYWFLLLQKPS